MQIQEIRIDSVKFVNDDSERDSIERLGQAASPGGVSSAATAALVRLTCQAYGSPESEIRRIYLNVHLEELRTAMFIIWYGNNKVGLT